LSRRAVSLTKIDQVTFVPFFRRAPGSRAAIVANFSHLRPTPTPEQLEVALPTGFGLVLPKKSIFLPQNYFAKKFEKPRKLSKNTQIHQTTPLFNTFSFF